MRALVTLAPSISPPASRSASFCGSRTSPTWGVAPPIVVSETLTLDRRIFAPEEWPALRAALESFRKLAETPLLVRPAGKGKGKA